VRRLERQAAALPYGTHRQRPVAGGGRVLAQTIRSPGPTVRFACQTGPAARRRFARSEPLKQTDGLFIVT